MEGQAKDQLRFRHRASRAALSVILVDTETSMRDLAGGRCTSYQPRSIVGSAKKDMRSQPTVRLRWTADSLEPPPDSDEQLGTSNVMGA